MVGHSHAVQEMAGVFLDVRERLVEKVCFRRNLNENARVALCRSHNFRRVNDKSSIVLRI